MSVFHRTTAGGLRIRVTAEGRDKVKLSFPARRVDALEDLMDEELRARIEAAQTISIMKVGRHLPRLRALIADMGLTGQAGYVERATMAAQIVLPLADAPAEAPYFSMILITKGADPWLSPS